MSISNLGFMKGGSRDYWFVLTSESLSWFKVRNKSLLLFFYFVFLKVEKCRNAVECTLIFFLFVIACCFRLYAVQYACRSSATFNVDTFLRNQLSDALDVFDVSGGKNIKSNVCFLVFCL